MPTRVLQGERIGKQGKLRVGCSATIFDATRKKILLTRRTDNSLWCLPGGGVDPGESVAETVLREVLEETGLRGKVVRMIGVYSSPDWLVEYPDGNRVQIIAMNFEVEPTGGKLYTNREVSEFGYFTIDEVDELELMLNHYQRILDAFAQQKEAFIR